MRLPGLRELILGALLVTACAATGDTARAANDAPAIQEPADDVPARNPATVPVPPGAPGPAQAAKEIAAGCSEKRYSDVGALLHPNLRRVWIEIGYNVKDYCDLITRNDTLLHVRIDKEEREGDYVTVYLTYVYREGVEQSDRSTFLPFKGMWKLTG